MAKIRHRIPHNKKILYEQTLQEQYLLPGMILSFKYNKPGVYDRIPLLFFMYKERNLIHGVNLNYLHEARVQKFFQQAQTQIPMWEENLLKLPLPYIRLQLSTPRAVTDFNSQLLYKYMMGRDKHYKEAYRSYDLGIASALKVVNYEVDFLKTELGKGVTKTTAQRKNVKQDFGKATQEAKKQAGSTSQDSEGLGKKK